MQFGISFYFRVTDAAFAVTEHLLGRQLALYSLASQNSQVSDPCSQNHIRLVSFLACSIEDDKQSACTSYN